MNFDVAGMSRQRSADENKNSDGSNEENEGFKNALASSLLDSNGDTNSSTSEEDNHRVLAFKDKAPTPCDGYQNNLRVLYSQNRGITQRAKSVRQIPSGPERVLGTSFVKITSKSTILYSCTHSRSHFVSP